VSDDDGYEVATITIRKTLTDDDLAITVDAVDDAGERLALLDALGLLEFAKLTLAEENLRDEDE
jgi:hypothetical protein